jgi:DNA-binding MarR family transcriptional regulator
MHMHHITASLPCACTTLRKASRALSRVYDEALAPAGLTVTQLGVLRAISRGDKKGEPLSRLAETLVMDRTSLYRALSPMVRSAWLLIKDAPKGRAKVVQLSKAGIRATADAAEYWERAQSRVIGEFGVDRWAALHKAMTELTALGVKLGGYEPRIAES